MFSLLLVRGFARWSMAARSGDEEGFLLFLSIDSEDCLLRRLRSEGAIIRE